MEERSAVRLALRFGAFEVDLPAGELRKQGFKIRLQEQPFQVLAALLENAGDVVAREDLRQKLWPGDTFVDFDHSLNNCINKVREALGDSASNPRFIETLARRGYRFIAPVEIIAPAAPDQPGPKAVEVERTDRRKYGRRALVPVGLLTALVAGLVVWNPGGWRQRLHGQSDSGPIRSLAVLPLENFSGDPAHEYLADNMTNQLFTDLATIMALR